MILQQTVLENSNKISLLGKDSCEITMIDYAYIYAIIGLIVLIYMCLIVFVFGWLIVEL